MTDKATQLSPEFMGYVLDNMKAEETVDPWEEIQELAKIDPACRQAVDAVRYGRMAAQDAALALALCQTKRAMMLHEKAVELLRLTPMPPIVMPSHEWRGPTHEGPTGPAV